MLSNRTVPVDTDTWTGGKLKKAGLSVGQIERPTVGDLGTVRQA